VASEWTAEQVREHIEAILSERDRQYAQRFAAQEKAIDAALAAQEKAVAAAMAAAEKAVTKAEIAAEKRFESVNEFRGQLADQAATLVTRPEYDARNKAQDDRLAELKGRLDTSGGRSSGLNAGWGVFVAALGALGILVGLVLALRR
jgi:Flp pilus assembly protein TadB